MKRKVIAFFLFLVLMAGIYALYIYFVPAKRVSQARTDIKMHSSVFLNDFEQNDTLSELKYKNKVVELVGIPAKLENNENGTNIIFDDKGKYIVICGMDSTCKKMAATIEINKNIRVKGFYSGYSVLDDLFMMPAEIKLTQCIIVKD